MLVKENALKEIEEVNTYYISEEKDIELYNRHQKIVEELNQLAEDLQSHTKIFTVTPAWLLRFSIDGTAFAPNTLRYDKG